MARKVDELGRIVLPVELRRLFGIRAGDALAISVDGDAVVLRKVEESCVFCDDVVGLRLHHDRPVCARCVSELRGGEPLRTPGVSGP
jgi:transcriptional pleiotropic regulator of transition state genes